MRSAVARVTTEPPRLDANDFHLLKVDASGAHSMARLEHSWSPLTGELRLKDRILSFTSSDRPIFRADARSCPIEPIDRGLRITVDGEHYDLSFVFSADLDFIDGPMAEYRNAIQLQHEWERAIEILAPLDGRDGPAG